MHIWGLLLCCFIWSWSGPALAALENNLLRTPAADALMVFETQAKSWAFMLQREPFSSAFKAFREDIAEDISEEFGLNLEDELLPMLGSHLSLAFYAADPIPVLMAMDIKPEGSAQSYARLVQRFQEKAKQDPRKQLKQLQMGNYTLYGFQRTDRSEDPVYMTRTQTTLLFGSIKRLKLALDPQFSQTMLKNQGFQAVYSRLKNHKFWLYANPAGITRALKQQKLDPEQWKATFNIYDSMGLGIDLNSQGLLARSVFQLKEKGLPGPQQRQVNALLKSWQKTPATLTAQRALSPAQVILFAQAAHLKALWQMAQAFPAVDQESIQLQTQLSQGFHALTGLNFEKDLLQPSDGNMGISVFYPPGVEAFDRPPQVVFSLGADAPLALRQTLTQKFQLNVDAFSGGKKSQPAIRFFDKPMTRYRGVPLYTARPNKSLQRLQQALFVEPVIAQVGDLWLVASSMDAMKLSIDQAQGKAMNLNNNRYLSQLEQIHRIDPQMGIMFLDLRSLGAMLEYLAGEDEEIETMKPTMNAFRSVLVGASHKDRVLEMVAVMDIQWDDLDFKILQQVIR
jgi:hypothetical protein